MRIEEMRSGLPHLRRKAEPEPARPFYFETASAFDAEEISAATAHDPVETCQMDEACWAVVSFEQLEAGGLTYIQARQLLDELDRNGVPGLCIVTDAAADRLAND